MSTIYYNGKNVKVPLRAAAIAGGKRVQTAEIRRLGAFSAGDARATPSPFGRNSNPKHPDLPRAPRVLLSCAHLSISNDLSKREARRGGGS